MKTALTVEDWGFAQFLQEAELEEVEAATVYEYARESAVMHDRARRYSLLPPEWQAHVDNGGALDMYLPDDARDLFVFTAYPYWNCILWPSWFPKVPWLSIPRDVRLQRMNGYLNAAKTELIAREDFCVVGRYDTFFCKDGKPARPDPERRIYTGGGEDVLLFINWRSADNAALAAAFKAWLAKNRPQNMPHPKARGFRRSTGESYLRWLAVARLLLHYSHVDAVELAQAHGNAGIIDERGDNACRSLGDFVKAFRANNARFHFPDEQPLCVPLSEGSADSLEK